MDRSSLTHSRLSKVQVAPLDSWNYTDSKDPYMLSEDHELGVRLSWFAAFIMICMGDLVESIAGQGF